MVVTLESTSKNWLSWLETRHWLSISNLFQKKHESERTSVPGLLYTGSYRPGIKSSYFVHYTCFISIDEKLGNKCIWYGVSAEAVYSEKVII